MYVDYTKTSTGEPCQGWYVTSEGTQGIVDIAELIIDELEEQQCRLCGDESFDAGWKDGLEKAIDIVKEFKPMSGLSTLATTTSCDVPDNTVVVGLCKDCARHGRCLRELSSIQFTEGGVTMACDDYVQNTATPTSS